MFKLQPRARPLGSDHRGFGFTGPTKSAFRRVSPYSTISIGQPGNNGSEYSRFEDDDHDWWRVVDVYNNILSCVGIVSHSNCTIPTHV